MGDAVKVYELRQGWYMKDSRGGPHGTYLSCTVPTCVHLDLLAHGKIPDPYKDYNETSVQWIGERDWIYKTTLPPLAPLLDGTTATLAFDGLDTIAVVKLNGVVILHSDNMFVPHRIDVTWLLLENEPNELTILFRSAFGEGCRIQDTHPEHKWLCSNGDPSRLAVRKAQYHWGWDWGPVLLTCGPWKPIRLEIYRSRISELNVHSRVEENLEGAWIVVEAVIEGNRDGRVTFDLLYEGQIVASENSASEKGESITATFFTRKPKLWFPRGHGNQPLYTVTAEVQFRDEPSHKVEKTIGLRRAELVQDLDEYGESFHFRINGLDVFCGGTNWIPATCFLPSMTEERYEKWLQMLVEGNQNMVRVWGGGVYEPSAFYSFCDVHGILVWQDFMFACGNYPTHNSFLASVRKEADAQIKRLQHHPSIVLFAGNNEDYQIREQHNLTYEPGNTDPESWLQTDFPARYIYEHILPEAIKKHAPQTLYRPGSPFSTPSKPSGCNNAGDIHQWNVWHGTQEPFQNYPQLTGRFVSEFGMQALPALSTVESFTSTSPSSSLPSDHLGLLHPQSRLLAHHNKATGATRRLWTYLSENLPLNSTTHLPSFIYQTQLLQSLALSTAYKAWRRQWWGKRQRQCGGALAWQLNDVWPCTSWAIADHRGRPKPAYYAVKRHMAGLAVGVQRENAWDWEGGQATVPPRSIRCNVWVAHSGAEDAAAVATTHFGERAAGEEGEGKFIVQVRFVDVATGLLQRDDVVRDLQVGELVTNGTTELAWFDVFPRDEEPYVVVALLYVETTEGVRELIGMDTSWPQPLKWLPFAKDPVDVGVQVRTMRETLKDGEGRVVGIGNVNKLSVKVERPVVCFTFEEVEGLKFSDNGFDLIPGVEKVVELVISEGANIEGTEWRWTYLGCEGGVVFGFEQKGRRGESFFRIEAIE